MIEIKSRLVDLADNASSIYSLSRAIIDAIRCSPNDPSEYDGALSILDNLLREHKKELSTLSEAVPVRT